MEFPSHYVAIIEAHKVKLLLVIRKRKVNEISETKVRFLMGIYMDMCMEAVG